MTAALIPMNHRDEIDPETRRRAIVACAAVLKARRVFKPNADAITTLSNVRFDLRFVVEHCDEIERLAGEAA